MSALTSTLESMGWRAPEGDAADMAHHVRSDVTMLVNRLGGAIAGVTLANSKTLQRDLDEICFAVESAVIRAHQNGWLARSDIAHEQTMKAGGQMLSNLLSAAMRGASADETTISAVVGMAGVSDEDFKNRATKEAP